MNKKEKNINKKRESFIDKLEWEGGVIGGLEYGLSEDDFHPDDKEARELWSKISEKFKELTDLADKFLEKFDPEPEE